MLAVLYYKVLALDLREEKVKSGSIDSSPCVVCLWSRRSTQLQHTRHTTTTSLLNAGR